MAASDACCPEVPAPAADMSGLLGGCAAPSAAGGGGGGGSASVLAQAYAFQKLCAHLQLRTDVQNVDVMTLSGFCRNCLSKWYAAGMAAQSSPIEYDAATQVVYGGWWPTLLHFAAAVPCACPRPHPHPVTHLSLSYPVPSPPFLPPAPTGAVLPPALPSAPDPAHLPRPSTSREESNPVCRPSRTQSDPPTPHPHPHTHAPPGLHVNRCPAPRTPRTVQGCPTPIGRSCTRRKQRQSRWHWCATSAAHPASAAMRMAAPCSTQSQGGVDPQVPHLPPWPFQ